MTRIEHLFAAGRRNILNVYCTAGFPRLDSTLEVMLALQDAGADMIELGMPYSDPVADGPVIQYSSSVALDNGMNLPTLFEQLKGFRNKIRVPVVLMGYLNPVMQYGFEKFCADAAAAGIDGLILPDMPVHEFTSHYREITTRYQLNFTFLVTPETSPDRVKLLDQLSSGFLYAVSSSTTTGTDKNIDLSTGYIARLKSLGLKNPLLVGFGIKDRASYEAACAQGEGAIIGSAYIAALAQADNIASTTAGFITGIRSKG